VLGPCPLTQFVRYLCLVDPMVEAGGCVAALPTGTTGVTLAPALHLLEDFYPSARFGSNFKRLLLDCLGVRNTQHTEKTSHHQIGRFTFGTAPLLCVRRSFRGLQRLWPVGITPKNCASTSACHQKSPPYIAPVVHLRKCCEQCRLVL
jgi:hypothetical protein